MKRFISMLLSFTLIFGTASLLIGCENVNVKENENSTSESTEKNHSEIKFSGKSESLSSGIKPLDVTVRDITENDKIGYYEFTATLLSETHEDGGNTLISPLSVYFALAMLANGAEGNTLAELEATLGMSNDELNLFVKSYMASLPDSDSCKMKIANSVWFRDTEWFNPKEDFLTANASYFGADIYKAPFDKTTVGDINSWVNGKTDGMIDSIIADISDVTVMYLINALTFDAEWEQKYDEYSVYDSTFFMADGTEKTVEFMSADESVYLEDENTTGFLKYYKNRNYAFVTLLPDEGISIDTYVKELDGDKLSELLKNKNSCSVSARMPKFCVDFDCRLISSLRAMGINDAFIPASANLSRLGESALGNLFVSDVIHKIHIEVNEAGTKAGAVTAIAVDTESESPYYVNLNRPFVYMIIDCENNMPLFIGTLNDPIQ